MSRCFDNALSGREVALSLLSLRECNISCYPFFLNPRLITRILLASLFLFAGTVHLVNPELFLPVMPPWIPFHLFCILASGVFELLGGVGLLVPVRVIRVITGWGLVLLLLAVFPANIYMAVAHVKVHGFPAHAWEAWARLPLQVVLIGLVFWVTEAWSGICRKGAAMKFDTP
jgi:uncharacterized membrane protein